jgi:hypothetical protein
MGGIYDKVYVGEAELGVYPMDNLFDIAGSQIRDQHTNKVGFPSGQAARLPVGDIPQFLHNFQYAFAGFLFNMDIVIHHP